MYIEHITNKVVYIGNTLAICLVITCVLLIIMNIRIKKAAVGKLI
jgi:hypothetical protein